MDLNFKVKNQKLTLSRKEFIVNKSHNYLVLNFDLVSTDWDECDNVFTIIKTDFGKNYQFRLKDDEGIVVPEQVLKGYSFKVSVYGIVQDNMRITTNEVNIHLENAGYTKSINSLDGVDSNDVFSEVYLVLDSKVDRECLSDIAMTGEYADLLNVPTEFNPSQHTHDCDDISDLSDVVGLDVKMMLNELSNEIRR